MSCWMLRVNHGWRGNPVSPLKSSRDTIFTIPFLRPQRVGIFGLCEMFGWMDLAVWKCVKYRKVAPDLRTYWAPLEALKLDKPDMNGSYDTSHATQWGMILESSTTIKARLTMRRTVIPYHSLNIMSQDLFKTNRKSSKMILHVKPSNTNKLLSTKKNTEAATSLLSMTMFHLTIGATPTSICVFPKIMGTPQIIIHLKIGFSHKIIINHPNFGGGFPAIFWKDPDIQTSSNQGWLLVMTHPKPGPGWGGLKRSMTATWDRWPLWHGAPSNSWQFMKVL